ncbi:LPS-assembly protein LptD [Sphingomonas morindae]|uniref:LPS-assembly protein LptD n=1 Tax=Sphingomonas morindae TaxID=1541170 RepID=A0ABY4X8C3_9SPHN|nr:LPS assembly protein LptD [Sphingomonas morindae]USI73129.1 LPS assembly protein LptD [Sphingomonas morindae]
MAAALALAAAPGLGQTVADGAAPAAADAGLARPVASPALAVAGENKPLADNEVAFTADRIDYDYQAKIVTASGDVRMVRQGTHLRADKVIWNRGTGKAHAYGSVAVQNPQGDTSYADELELTDDLKNGIAQNLLLVLENGGRMAALKGQRQNGVYTLEHAAYSPCDVTTDHGCPKQPLWEITADRVTYDPERHRLSYRDARLRFFGVPLFWLPAFSHPDGSGQGGNSGLLVPDASYNSRNGLSLQLPYFWQIAPNRDLTVTPHLFTAVLPMIEAQYRELNSLGAFQIHGYATSSSQASNNVVNSTREFRGYIDANGRYQLGPDWTIRASIREVTDKTFLRRYEISDDDRLRSTISAERIDDDSYLSIAGWRFRTLVLGQSQKTQPFAVPLIDYRRRIGESLLGGTFTLQANTLAITRDEGQSTQRAFAGVQWQKWSLLPTGQLLTFTAYARGDVYHSADNDLTTTTIYQGDPGWQTRGIAAAAVDMRWPFVGTLFGGTQRVTPRVQFVASPHAKNLAIPNEDARAIDLEDSNLFALNRFNGYDRWEGDTRVTYGLDYALDLPRFALRSVIGQSYRLAGPDSLFPDGTGLSGDFSDIVGRTTIRYGSFVSLTHRFRLDKHSLAVRRSEVDATLGTQDTYVLIGYLNLNRNISPEIEDLRDHQELRLGGRVLLMKRWSVFGSTTVDLTNEVNTTNPLASTADGFNPVQSRVGLAYEDDCFRASIQWHRDFAAFGDARRGSTIQFQLAFKNLGR